MLLPQSISIYHGMLKQTVTQMLQLFHSFWWCHADERRGLHLVEWCATDEGLFSLLFHAQEIVFLQLPSVRWELLPSNYRFVFNSGAFTRSGLQFGQTTKVYSKSNHHGRYLKPKSNHPLSQKGSNPSSSNRVSNTCLRKQQSITLF